MAPTGLRTERYLRELHHWYQKERGFLGGSVVKNLPANTGDMGSIPGLGRSPGKGNGNSLQYSCLGNAMDRGTWRATVHEVTDSDMAEKLNPKQQPEVDKFCFVF